MVNGPNGYHGHHSPWCPLGPLTIVHLNNFYSNNIINLI